MTARILVALVLAALAAAVAWWLDRRRGTEAPLAGAGEVPRQLDRKDFARPDAPWLVVLFTSTRCDSCAGLAEKAAPLASDEVAVVEIEYFADPELHRRYAIEAAPIIVVADADGVTRASFTGPCTAAELWTAVADVRGEASRER